MCTSLSLADGSGLKWKNCRGHSMLARERLGHGMEARRWVLSAAVHITVVRKHAMHPADPGHVSLTKHSTFLAKEQAARPKNLTPSDG